MLEAWAHAVPVVAARARGPETLIENDVSGVLVACDDADGLARAIRRIVGDPAFSADLVAAGQRAHAQNFTEAAVVARYQDFFEEVTA